MKQTLTAVGAIAMIALAVWFLKSSSDTAKKSEDFPDGVWFKCVACQHEFNKSLEAIAAHSQTNPGQSVPCDSCGKQQALRASKCPLPECGKLVTGDWVVIAGKPSCPICKKPLP